MTGHMGDCMPFFKEKVKTDLVIRMIVEFIRIQMHATKDEENYVL